MTHATTTTCPCGEPTPVDCVECTHPVTGDDHCPCGEPTPVDCAECGRPLAKKDQKGG